MNGKGENGHGPLVGREDLLATLRKAATRAAWPGTVLTGESGVGKSALLIALLEDLAGPDAMAGPTGVSFGTHLVVGCAGLASVPFGAVAALLSDAERPGSDAATLIADAVWRVRRQAVTQRVVIGVDDPHHLDPASVGLVRTLGMLEGVALVLTRTTGVDWSTDLTSWLTSRAVPVHEVTALDRDQTGALMYEMLGGRPTPAALDAVCELACGLPLLTVLMVLEGRETGRLHPTGPGGSWHLDGDLSATPQVTAVVASRIGDLPDDQRDALELCSLADGIDAASIRRLVTPATLDALVDRRLLQVTRDAARCAHPMIGEAVRAGLGPFRRAELCERLAGLADAGPFVFAAVLDELDHGRTPSMPARAVAARFALSHAAPDVAARLARITLGVPFGDATMTDHELLLLEAQAQLAAGKHDDLVLAAARWLAAGVDHATAVAVIVPWVLDLAWSRGSAADARRLLDLVSGDDEGDVLEAVHACLMLSENHVYRAECEALLMLDRPDLTLPARLIALTTSALCASFKGPLIRSVEHGQAALDLLALAGDRPGLLTIRLLVAGSVSSSARALGDRETARQVAGNAKTAAEAAGAFTHLLLAMMLEAGLLEADGELEASRARIDQVIDLTSTIGDPAGQGCVAHAMRAALAHVLGEEQSVIDHHIHLARRHERYGHPAFVDLVTMGELYATAPSVASAVRAADLADHSYRRGRWFAEAIARNEQARHGDPRGALPRLRAIADAMGSPLFDAFVAATQALVDADLPAAAVAATHLEESGAGARAVLYRQRVAQLAELGELRQLQGYRDPAGPVPTPGLRIRVLQPDLSVTIDDSPVRLQRAGQRLLAICLLLGPTIPVDVIIEHLWPGCDARAGRLRLNAALTRVRRALGLESGTLRHDGEVLEVALPDHVDVDVLTFRRLRQGSIDERRRALALASSSPLIASFRYDDAVDDGRARFEDAWLATSRGLIEAGALAADDAHDRHLSLFERVAP